MPNGSRLTVRQLRRILDNHMFEVALRQDDETSGSMEERSVMHQSADSARSEPERTDFNEMGSLTGMLPENRPRAKACSDTPKQNGQVDQLSNFSDAHSGLARLVFELSGVLFSFGDRGKPVLDDYSNIVHECTLFMLDVANILQHLKTDLQLSGGIPCNEAKSTGPSTKPSFTVWGKGETALLPGQVRLGDVNSDARTGSTNEGGRTSSSQGRQKTVSSSPAASSSQPHTNVQDSKYCGLHVRTAGDLPNIVDSGSDTGDRFGVASLPDLPVFNTAGTLPSMPDESLAEIIE